jgi:UDP-2,3-diacylglucosamine pyrophosphatase LpxH
MTFDPEIATLLLSCEKDGPACPYGDPVVRLDSEGRDVIIVSDFHLARGKEADGRYSGLENFFFDAQFERFLRHVREHDPERIPLLVINGDFVDFLRITDVPEDEGEFEEWRSTLRQIGFSKTIGELKESVSKKERTYGFKAFEYKSVFQLSCALQGHKRTCIALATWLVSGGRIAIVKGNHDLEWYWLAVRNCFRLDMARCIQSINGSGVLEILKDIVLPNVIFVDHALSIDSVFFIEHGHRFDTFAKVDCEPFLSNGKELNLPLGAFFSRYVINRIESVYPYIDNVRPRGKLLPLLFGESFFLGLQILFKHLRFLLIMIPKRKFLATFSSFLWLVAPMAFLIGFIAIFCMQWLQPWVGILKSFYVTPLGAVLANPIPFIVSLALCYSFVRMVVYFQLKEVDDLSGNALKLFRTNGGAYQFVCFGHTHNPDQLTKGDEWYWNSGTWIPIIEMSSAHVREDRTFSVVNMEHDANRGLIPRDLKRWNDDAGRLEDIVVIKKNVK